MKKTWAALIVGFSLSSSAMAGECSLLIKRVACKGQETESFKKCKGKEECTEIKKTADAEACAKQALKACENSADRQKVTKLKTITAKFNGADVEGGKNFCEASRPDFNKCE